MIRITIPSFRADYASDAASLLHRIADSIAESDGNSVASYSGRVHDTVKVEVEKLCEFCDGEGEIDDGDKIKKCFNCNGPDYDAQREGK